MATSSFTQNFKVEKKQGKAFVKSMSKQTPPTLDKNFKPQTVSVNDVDVKSRLERVLS